MNTSRLIRRGLVAGISVLAFGAGTASAEGEFDWRQFEGETLNFLSSNHPWSNAVLEYQDEFEELTGITLRVDTFNEDQMRQRLNTVLQAGSSDVDMFMSLKPREGLLYYNSGWYADLMPFVEDPTMTSPDYDFDDLSSALVAGETYDGQLTGIPLNIEGPIFYWRTDVLEQCDVAVPETLEDIRTAAQAIADCDSTDVTPFTSRGLRGAIPYTFSSFLYNMGGEYQDEDGNSSLCTPEGISAIDYYASLLRDLGPDGVANYTFYQITETVGQGRTAMSFNSSNEFGPIMEFEGRSDDLAVKPLPPGADSGVSRPVVIGWGMSVSAYSENQGPAWYFIQWATSKDMQERLAQEGIAPPRESVFSSDSFQAWVDELPVRQQWVDALVEMAETGTSYMTPMTERVPEAREIIGEAVDRVLLGQADAETAACEADESMNALLARD